MRKILVAAGLFILAAPLAMPSALAQERGRVGTVTRLVKIFLDKEAALATAVRGGNAVAVEAMLEDDFEARVGYRAANPVPRAEWVQELMRTRDAGGEATRMAVHDLGENAVVSFNQDGPKGPLFVVDVWRKAGTDWKLKVRYASPAGSPQQAIPGVGASEPEIPKKY